MALNGLFCADVRLRNNSLTHSLTHYYYHYHHVCCCCCCCCCWQIRFQPCVQVYKSRHGMVPGYLIDLCHRKCRQHMWHFLDHGASLGCNATFKCSLGEAQHFLALGFCTRITTPTNTFSMFDSSPLCFMISGATSGSTQSSHLQQTLAKS